MAPRGVIVSRESAQLHYDLCSNIQRTKFFLMLFEAKMGLRRVHKRRLEASRDWAWKKYNARWFKFRRPRSRGESDSWAYINHPEIYGMFAPVARPSSIDNYYNDLYKQYTDLETFAMNATSVTLDLGMASQMEKFRNEPE